MQWPRGYHYSLGGESEASAEAFGGIGIAIIVAIFGIFAILFKQEIYTEPRFTHLFLYTMAAGVVARLVSLVLDGRPRKIFYFFIASEAIGVVLIAVYTSQLAGAG